MTAASDRHKRDLCLVAAGIDPVRTNITQINILISLPSESAFNPHAARMSLIPTTLLPVGASIGIDAGTPGYILSTFFPKLLEKLKKNPRLAKFLSYALAVHTVGPVVIRYLSSIFSWLITYQSSSVVLHTTGSLWCCLKEWLFEQKSFSLHPSQHATWSSGKRLLYEIGIDSRVFTYQKKCIWLTITHTRPRRRRHSEEDEDEDDYSESQSAIVTLTCFGRSPQVIRNLLNHVWLTRGYFRNTTTNTFRATRQPHHHGVYQWANISRKSPRPLNTVDLDPVLKKAIMTRLGEYMSTAAEDWYARRGIPMRTGLLFYGPPGTGKTTFALAIAGHFHLDIHILSLLDSSLSDDALVTLMRGLPGRVLLLLEDIDSVGLTRESAVVQKAQSSLKKKTVGASGVTLSGLLNAIDGVAAPEGHILIMTTNAPDKLDEALIRSGRITQRVGFTNATKSQAKDIFLRMYQSENTGVAVPNEAKGKPGDEVERECSQTQKQFNELSETERAKDAEQAKDITSLTVDHLSDRFAALTPDVEFSPASLQDYLLQFKDDPARAILMYERWQILARSQRFGSERAAVAKEAEKREAMKTEIVETEMLGKEAGDGNGHEDGKEAGSDGEGSG